ncbi:MAG TPA: PilZ domain-containing protein [bacterium]|nr:PilZ domain-containing protein [bacterium]
MDAFFRDRRGFRRIARKLGAEFKLMDDHPDSSGEIYQPSEIINISRGGVCLGVKKLIEKGKVMRLNLPPENGFGGINTFCEVAWCRKEAGEYKAGVSFMSLDDEECGKIEELEKSYN